MTGINPMKFALVFILSVSALFSQAGNAGYGVGGGSGTGSYTFSAPLSLSGSTVSLGASGVTAGPYTCLNATVNTQGLITTATSGTCTGGSGTVTHTVGALTLNQLIGGNGTADIKSVDLTGDVTTSGGLATTLATVNSSPGSFGSSSLIPVFTVDGKGRITAISTASASSGFSNPMTTVGDLIVGGTSGAATRLAAGTSGYSLVSNGPGVAPSWTLVTGSGGGNIVVSSLPATCTQGSTYFLTTSSPNKQLYDCTTTNTLVQHELLGSTGALSTDSTTGALDIVTTVVPRIAASNAFTGRNSFTVSDFNLQAVPLSPSAGKLSLYANNDGSFHMINAAGTDSALATGAGFANPMTAQDDVIVGGASGAATRLAVSPTIGQVLGVDPSGHVAYINQTGSTGTTFTGGTVANPIQVSNSSSAYFKATSGGHSFAFQCDSGFACFIIDNNAGTLPIKLFDGAADSSIQIFSTGVVTSTPWVAAGGFMINPTTTNPTCSGSGDIGKMWFDTTTSTTAFKVCVSTAGTIAWVTK